MPIDVLEPLVRKLSICGPLPDEDREAILALPFTVRNVPAARYLVREGEPPRSCSVLLSGFACRHKIVGDGGRQIVALHIPGDAIDLQGLYLNSADHNAQTLTPAEVAVIPITPLQQLATTRPAIARAVLLTLLIEASILREWVTNVGRRDARTSLAHFLCEFATRMDQQQQQSGRDGYDVPMTQEQIGDALGLTSVHVNRSLKVLESEGLIRRNGRTVSIPNVAGLREVADFSALYLHLDQQG